MARSWNKLPDVAGPTTVKGQGVRFDVLFEFLTHNRPAGSEEEKKIAKYVFDMLPNREHDDYGNFWCTIGEDPTVMFSCHTDTVAKKGGRQNIQWHGNFLCLAQPEPGRSLGADDGAGMWLMLQLIEAGVPGLYIFHREEEIGGLGSKHLTKKRPELVNGIKMAIAFDRRGTDSVITHQMIGRCCSDTFGKAMCDAINAAVPELKYETDPTGSFTDTANYIDLIGECTNISVGYYNEHGREEYLDVEHLLRLRTAMLAIDYSALPIEREAGEVDPDDHWYGYGSYGGYSNQGTVVSFPNDPIQALMDVIKKRPFALATWLDDAEWTAQDLEEMLDEVMIRGAVAKPTKSADKSYECLVCEDCNHITDIDDLDYALLDGAECPWCLSNNTFADFSTTAEILNGDK